VRVTQNMVQRTALADNLRVRRQLLELQEQASSGLRVNRPSDDPSDASRAALLRAEIESGERLAKSVEHARARLETVDTQLGHANDVLVRARELATQAANDTADAGSRRLVAAEIAQLHEQLVATSNLRHQGAYLFGGYATGQRAFEQSGSFADGSPAPVVSYGGDGAEIELEIEEGILVRTTLDGRRVFLGDADGSGSPDATREDLFDVLASLWQSLESNDRAGIAASLDRIARGQEQLDVERARVGGRLTRVEAADAVLSRRGVDLAGQLSSAEDADSVEVYSALAHQQTLLQASLQVTARAIQPSLLDFLQ